MARRPLPDWAVFAGAVALVGFTFCSGYVELALLLQRRLWAAVGLFALSIAAFIYAVYLIAVRLGRP